MSGILRLENLNKGTTLKQGDKTVLSYRLSDADGEQLNIAGKTAVARLMHPDFTRIGYESEALTVSADNIVQFSIDSIIPSRLYYLEITVDGQYIFPSRSDEGKLSIDRSSMGAEITIIENYGIDAVVRKAVDLINEDPSLIIDENKLINEIIANTSVGSIEEYYQEYRDAIKEYADLKPKALSAITKSDDALTRSQNALSVANGIDAKATNALNLSKSADALSKSVQDQFNQVIIDGDSSVEAAQARVDADGQTNPTLKARLDKEHNEVTTQLTQEAILGVEGRNAEMPLKIETYDGSGQSTHPSVLAFEGGWNHRNFWMAHTPYPNSQDEYENPSILASSDGINWFEPTGISNPIDKPSNDQINAGWHMSDVHIFMNGVTMECWYRLTDTSTAQDYYLRKTSLNGVDWSERETVYTPSNPSFSPAIIVDEGKYKMWYVSQSKVYYIETTTSSFDWSVPVEVDLNNVVNGETYIPWHLDVKKEGNEYILTMNSFLGTSPNRRRILISRSTTETKFDNQKLVLMPTSAVSKNWDNGSLYRSSLVKYYDEYRLYYSAIGNNVWGIGMLTGTTPETVSYKPYLTDYFSPIIKNSTIKQLNLGYEKSNLNHESLSFHTPGVKSVRMKNVSPNRLDILNENGGLATIAAYTGLLDEVVTRNLVNGNPNNMFELPKKSRANVTHDDPFWFLNVGVSEAGITTTKPNTLNAVRANSTLSADLQVGHLIVSDVPNNNTAGAIKFNNQSKGFENYNGKNWGVMTRLVSVPTNSSATGIRGDIAYGTDYMYVCISENTWRRTSLETW